MTNVKRVHYYHADATALGGRIKAPFEQLIPVQAPLSLPPVGGYAATRVERFRLEAILSFEAAYTQLAGSVSHKTGGWTTLVTAAVEGLNVLDVITADRLVAQIATEHPLVGYRPTVTFVGTRFENLRIGGHLVEPVLDLDLCNPQEGDEGARQGSTFDDKSFLAAASEQYRRMSDLPKWVKGKKIPAWVSERYSWDNSEAKRSEKGMVLCSLVNQVNGEFPGTPFGHVLEIPEIGKVFLGELIVDHNSYRIIMMRLELGCTTQGSVSVGTATIEGRTSP